MKNQKKAFIWNNINRLILVKFLTTLYFYIPYMTLYFQGRGFNYIQINSMWGIVVFTMFLTEIPTGLLADRWGRRRAVQVAIFLQFIGELLFLFVQDYWLFALSAVIAGLGFSFGSGAIEALIYDALKCESREHEMSKVMGRFNGAGYLGFILSFGISGLLVPQANQSNITTALIATIIAVGLGFLVTLTLKPETDMEEDSQDQPNPLTLLKEGLVLLRKNKVLQKLVLLSILTIAFWDYLSTLYQPYFKMIDVPDGLFGPTLALASLFAFLAAHYVHRIERRIGPRWSLLIATLGPGLLYMVMYINRSPWLGILLVALFRGFNAMKHPLFADYNNRQIESHNRATVLSLISMVSGGYTALMGLLIGAIADHSLLGAFLFCGVLVTLGSLFVRVDEKVIASGY
jgi:MFS family permease